MSYRSLISRGVRLLEKPYETYNNIYVSKSAVLHNLEVYQKLIAGGQVIPVLKANAYGHGIEPITQILKGQNIPYIAVDGYYEALRVHYVSKQPVLVMGMIDSRNYKHLNLARCTFVVQDEAAVRALAATGKKVKIHLELETGMARQGVQLDQLDDLLLLIKTHPKLQLEGVMSHLADADNPTSSKHVGEQVQRFDQVVERIQAAGFTPKYIHLAQSAGSTKVTSRFANTLRVGIGLYGISPLEATDKAAPVLASLKPALQFTSTVGRILNLKPGDTVSYNRIFTVTKPSRIAVLPVGYYEGVPRELSNAGLVQISGKYYKIAGRVCMNHTMVDITDSPVQVGDEATMISSNVADKNSIASISRDHKLFSYGLLVRLASTIRRTAVR